MEYAVYGDLFIIYPKPYSIYLRGTIGLGLRGLEVMVEGLGAYRLGFRGSGSRGVRANQYVC